ncbi:MAG: hypothetical protein U0990_11600 [Candidatus Nanopelagicales bacterium]|nr:hypothetical protein [Candidatus Nanopelagicales bacterium]MDZ4250711.1 hypothetical protein [Candidatus Nanopelagicales bacterium]
MALTSYLMDTSVISSRRLERSESAAERVQKLLEERRLSYTLVTALEVNFGSKGIREWDHRNNMFTAYGSPCEIVARDWERAYHVQMVLAGQGHQGRAIPDLLIAAAGERTGRAVLHYDADFDLIAAVTDQATEWVVPKGSID